MPLRPPLVQRADLYWPPHAWAGGTSLVWEDRAVAEQVGTLQRWEASRTRQDLMWQVIDDPVATDLLAVCLGWGTVTVDVALAVAGHETLISGPRGRSGGLVDWSQQMGWDRMPRSVRRLYGAGLIERGASLSPAATVPWAIRVRTGPALKALLRHLDADRLTWVTGGRKPQAPTFGDRHNTLAASLGLALAENAHVAAVLGPRSAAHHDLDITGRTKPTRRAADLVVVLDSGMRIAIEVTANGNPVTLRKKIVAWIELLANTTLAESGLRVVFVDAADPYRSTPNEVYSPLTRILAEELDNRPAATAVNVHKRILVTRWKQWMPADGTVTADLARMLTVAWNRGPWVLMALRRGLDAFKPNSPELFATVASEAKQMAECPAVLRAARPALRRDGA